MNDMEREYRQLCRIDENPGVQGLAQLGRNAIDRVTQLESENAYLRAANSDGAALLQKLQAERAAIKGDYDEAAHLARHFIRDDPGITPRGAIIRLGDKCTDLFCRRQSAEQERDQLRAELAAAVAERDSIAIERDHARLTLREIAQILIEQIGSVGPENAVNAALRACEVIESMASRLSAIYSAPVVAWLSTDCIGERYLCFSAPDGSDPVVELIARPSRESTSPIQGIDMTNNLAKIRAALEWGEDSVFIEALAALSELERAAAQPAPKFEAPEVTRPMCHGAWARFWSEPNSGDSCDQAKRWLEAWRTELGPALGLVELREPTPEECERIEEEYARNERRVYTRRGRDMADAVIAVMWPKEGL